MKSCPSWKRIMRGIQATLTITRAATNNLKHTHTHGNTYTQRNIKWRIYRHIEARAHTHTNTQTYQDRDTSTVTHAPARTHTHACACTHTDTSQAAWTQNHKWIGMYAHTNDNTSRNMWTQSKTYKKCYFLTPHCLLLLKFHNCKLSIHNGSTDSITGIYTFWWNKRI